MFDCKEHNWLGFAPCPVCKKEKEDVIVRLKTLCYELYKRNWMDDDTDISECEAFMDNRAIELSEIIQILSKQNINES